MAASVELRTGERAVRDTLLQTGTSIVLLDGRYLLVAVAAAVVGFFFAGLIDRLGPVIVVLDAVALGFFCTVGADAVLRLQLSPVAAVFIGTVTAAGSGTPLAATVAVGPYLSLIHI